MRAGRQEALFIAACFAAASAILFLSPAGRDRFGAFAAGAPPLLMLAVATVLGAVAIGSLRRNGFFAQAEQRGTGLAAAARLASVLALPPILADLASPFPEAANVPWPDAWLFYPAIAVVAVAVLQLAPLALAQAFTGRAWLAIATAALTEPALQAVYSLGQPGWQIAFVAGQVFLAGLAGLILFRRHGIGALIWFRLVYYLLWHILWGAARLPLLFAGP